MFGYPTELEYIVKCPQWLGGERVVHRWDRIVSIFHSPCTYIPTLYALLMPPSFVVPAYWKTGGKLDNTKWGSHTCTEIETARVLKSVGVCGKCTSKNNYLTLSFRPFMGEKPMTSMTLLTCEASALHIFPSLQRHSCLNLPSPITQNPIVSTSNTPRNSHTSLPVVG